MLVDCLKGYGVQDWYEKKPGTEKTQRRSAVIPIDIRFNEENEVQVYKWQHLWMIQEKWRDGKDTRPDITQWTEELTQVRRRRRSQTPEQSRSSRNRRVLLPAICLVQWLLAQPTAIHTPSHGWDLVKIGNPVYAAFHKQRVMKTPEIRNHAGHETVKHCVDLFQKQGATVFRDENQSHSGQLLLTTAIKLIAPTK